MKIIAGLGNPGRKYEHTKHNMGFMVIDEFARRHGVSVNMEKYDALYGRTIINGETVLLVKPQTFMNLSGDAVANFAEFYKVEHEDLMVIYDDCEIDKGTLRIRAKGSAGTHNGMRDIVSKLGWTDFPRLRMGIGNRGSMELYEYVLSPFSDDDMKEFILPGVEKACDALDCFLENGIDLMMNRYNTPKKPKIKKEEISEDVSASAEEPETSGEEK